MRHQFRFSIVFVAIFFFLLIVLAWSHTSVSAVKYTVDDDEPADFSKIQDAIDSADSGDIIQVNDGLYYEIIEVDKRLTIIGKGSDTTTINGGGKEDVVVITGDGTSFSGFKVLRSGGNAGDSSIKIKANDTKVFENLCGQSKVGIYLSFMGAHSQNERNEVFDNICTGNDDVGISLAYSKDSLIRNNNCSENTEIGIRVINSRTSTIRDNNCSGMNQGIHVQNSNNLTITNNSCLDNTGNGISLDSVEHSEISNNTCRDNGDGIIIKVSGMNTLMGNGVLNNENGIHLLSSDGNSIRDNMIDENTNRGMFIRGSKENEIAYNTIMHNPTGIVLITHLSTHSEGNTIHNNVICDNDDLGMDATGNGDVLIDAEHNFWGHATGPYNENSNSAGMGDDVSDFIDFQPWTHVPAGYTFVTAIIDSITPKVVLLDELIHMVGSIGEQREIKHYVWTSSLEGEIYNGSGREFDISNLSQGVHIIIFNVIDFRGIRGIEAVSSVTVHTAPTVRIVSISPSPALHNEIVTFTGEGIDLDNINQYLWLSSFDGVLYSGSLSSFDHQGLMNGTHIIYLKVMDEHGVWSAEVNQTLVIRGMPAIKIIQVNPNPATIGTEVTFSVEGGDDGTIELYNWTSDIDGPLYNGSHSVFSTSNLSIGTHNISLVVQDDTGIFSKTVTIRLEIEPLVIENEKPSIVVTGPANNKEVSEKFKVKGTASDEDGTITKVELSIDGGSWHIAQGTDSWSLVLDAADLTLGEHNITIRCYDGTDYSAEQTVKINVVEADDNGDPGFIPGFEVLMTIAAMLITSLFVSVVRRD